MRFVAALVVVLSCWSLVYAKRGNSIRGGTDGDGRDPPGLDRAKAHYEEAKLLVDQAKLLVWEAEKNVETVRGKASGGAEETQRNSTDSKAKKDGGEQGNGQGNLGPPKPADQSKPQPEKNLGPEPGAPRGGTFPIVYEKNPHGSLTVNQMTQNDKWLAPSICGSDRDHIREQCAENRPICKFKKIPDPDHPRGFRLSTELEKEQPDLCIRRCDKRYGLGKEFCHQDEDCIQHLETCTDCDLLMTKNCHPWMTDVETR